MILLVPIMLGVTCVLVGAKCYKEDMPIVGSFVFLLAAVNFLVAAMA